MHLQYYFGDDFKPFEDDLLSIPHTKIDCPKNTVLSGLGEPMDRNHYILSGLISTSFTHESGRIKAFGFYGSGTFAPLYFPGNFGIEQSIVFTAAADLIALAFERKAFGAYLNANPKLNEAMYGAYMRLVCLLIEDNVEQLFCSGLEKISHFLYCYIKNNNTQGLEVPLTQEELAHFVGMNRANVAKYLKQLREEDVLATGRNRIIIKNPEKLYGYGF